MSNSSRKTLRLLFPQWQGGNNPLYSLGARLLAWLAPQTGDPLVEVSVKPDDGTELPKENGVVLRWIRDNNIQHLAIHFDLDVLDPACFRSLYFSDPQAAPNAFDGVTQGKMTFPQLTRLMTDAATKTDIVGLSIAEHLPWDAQNLKNMLEQLPLLGDRSCTST